MIFKPNPGPQTEFLAATEREVLYGGSAGGGKGLRPEEKVLTPWGWVELKDLKVGSRICGTDGSNQKILGYYKRGIQPRYKLTFADGSEVICDEDHLWVAHVSSNGRKVRGEFISGAASSRKWTTKQIYDHYQSSTQRLGIPIMSAPAQMTVSGKLLGPKKFLTRAPYPYTLGVLLGDGCWTQDKATFFTVDQQIVDEVELETGVTLKVYDKLDGDGATYVVPKDLIKPFIEPLGLWGTYSNTKFLPHIYLFAPTEYRWALMQGLMDTDGWAETDGDCYYTSVSKELIDGVAHLARSLGFYVTFKEKIPTFTYKGEERLGQKAYTIRIKGPNPENLFRLDRKRERVEGKVYQSMSNWIEGIERIEDGETICITVSNPNSLFVIENFIVTHNSYAMLADPVRYFTNPNFRGVLFRRSNDELRELIQKSQMIYPKAIPDMKWTERDKTWVNQRTGATFWMTYLDRDEDVMRYQGQAFSFVGWDELTQWPSPYAYNYMRSRLRVTKDSNLPLTVRSTTNPGGPGMQWVKKMFIDPAPPNTPFWATDIETGKVLTWPEGHSKSGQPLFKRRFIPATLFDNPYLAEDGNYEANLLSLPEHQRRQLLYGDWDINEGAAFSEFNRSIHVIDPFEIPGDWVRFRACDYGYGSYSAVLWFAVAPSGQLVVYRELYVSKVTADDLAEMILELEAGEKIYYGVLDSSLWHKRGDRGPSLAEVMIRKGCRWRPSDRSKGSRIAGKNEIHRRLKVDPYTQEPGIVFFHTCTNLISQLPAIPLDKHNPEDVDTKCEDHLFDALRYGCMTRPTATPWDFGNTSGRDGFQKKPVCPVFGY